MSNSSHFATNAIHVGQDPAQWKCHAIVPPIFLSTTFEQEAPAVTYVSLWLLFHSTHFTVHFISSCFSHYKYRLTLKIR